LHKALLKTYADDTLKYGGTKNNLVRVLNGLADSSTVDLSKTITIVLAGKMKNKIQDAGSIG